MLCLYTQNTRANIGIGMIFIIICSLFLVAHYGKYPLAHTHFGNGSNQGLTFVLLTKSRTAYLYSLMNVFLII